MIKLATGVKIDPNAGPNYEDHNTLPKEKNKARGKLVRGPDGRFPDNDLATILMDTTEEEAGIFRARGSPAGTLLVQNNIITD